MRSKTVEHVMKHSIVYGYALTQPFVFYLDAQPLLQDKLLAEAQSLQYGEHSEVVRNLQYKLTKLGHYDDGIDGVYGLLTEHAIKGFQSSHNITVTGSADQATMKQLVVAERKSKIAEIKNSIYSIEYGDHNEDVKKVQELLFYYGYYKGSIDGIYGPLTESAIKQVKNENLLEANSNGKETKEHDNSSEQDSKEDMLNEENNNDIVQLKVDRDFNAIVEEAKLYIGTQYQWGGTSPSGFDCSGFVQFVYEQHNITIPRTVNEIWNFSSTIESPSIGDLVFFETYQPGPSHLGFYLGNGDFIHAGASNGVQISNMDESYWSNRYLGAKRIN